MEYWEITKDRAQKTLPVWLNYVSTLKIGGLGPVDLEVFIDGYEPLVQQRTVAQDEADAAARAVQGALLKMKILGTRVPAIIEGQLDEDESLMKDVDDLYAVNPRTESTILKRARMLYPVWLRANAVLAAMTPPQPPVTRVIQAMPYTVVTLKALLDDFTELVRAMEEKDTALNVVREGLRAHDRGCDRLNKRWYKVVKAQYDPGDEVYEALAQIPTEPSTPAPEVIEIDTVTQGGEEGLQVLVAYVPGGGAHATTKTVEWTLPGDAEPWTRTVPLDASGNALGPFAVGAAIQVRTKVENSVGTRTSAPRTITIEEPIE